MKITEIIESSGYIPQNEKEAHDPRYEMAITCDIKPNEDKKQAAKFNFKLKDGKPPIIRSDGKITETINIDNEKGIGIEPSVHNNIGYSSFKVLMKPSTYLSLVAKMGKWANPEYQASMNNYIKSGNTIAAPMIRFAIPDKWEQNDYSSSAVVRGHEGRHRMTAILDLEGDDFTEVIVRISNKKGEIFNISRIKSEWIRQINSRCVTQDNMLNSSYRITKGPFFKFGDSLLTEYKKPITNVQPYVAPTMNPAFKSWFANSKVIDDAGNPIIVYHGTTHDFTNFSMKMSNQENYYGRGYYFTSSKQDTKNYAGFGADLRNRIENRAEEIYNNMFGDYEDEPEYNSSEANTLRNKAKEQAKKEIAGKHLGVVMPCYLNIINPVIVKGNGGTWFEYRYNEKTGKETGSFVKLYNTFLKCSDYNKDLWNDIMEKIGDPEFNAYQFEHVARTSNYTDDLYESGGIGALIGKIYRNMGFDGIILDTNVAEFSRWMNVDEDTTHYIVWKSTQIKSAIGNAGTFNRRSQNILSSREVDKNKIMESKEYGNPALDYLSKQKSIAWDFFGTLYSGDASTELRDFILEHPDIDHYLITTVEDDGKLSQYLNACWAQCKSKLRTDKFKKIIGLGREYSTKGTAKNKKLHSYLRIYKEKTCQELHIPVLVDDDALLRKSAGEFYGIKIIDPVSCLIKGQSGYKNGADSFLEAQGWKPLGVRGSYKIYYNRNYPMYNRTKNIEWHPMSLIKLSVSNDDWMATDVRDSVPGTYFAKGKISDGSIEKFFKWMEKQEEKISESTEILKLKSNKNEKVDDAIGEINDKFPVNPFNPDKRAFYIKNEPVAYFQVGESGGRLRIRDIFSLFPQQGVGSLLLKRILNIADKFGLEVELTASPYGFKKVPYDKLKEWYRSFGFTEESGYDISLGYMIRPPKTTVKESSDKYTKKTDFRFKNGALLMQRVGPINAQKQVHTTGNVPPVKRGMWAFPYPAMDLFFTYHKIEPSLPKECRMDYIRSQYEVVSPEEYQALWDKREQEIKKKKALLRPKTFLWNGPIYSHIAPSGMKDDDKSWYLWTDLKAWAKAANASMVAMDTYSSFGIKPNPAEKKFLTYSVDHLEVFLPQKAEITKQAKI